MKTPLAVAAWLTAAAGCISKSYVEPVRYFTPEPPSVAEAAARSGRPRPARALWLRRVVAASHVHERMARRTSDVEIGFDDLRRWTEPPASYVERALARELFEERGVVRADAGRVPRLDVVLLAFEERARPARVASVAISVTLLDARGVALLDRTYAEEAAVTSNAPEEVARAMGTALGVAVRSAAADVDAALRGIEP